MNLGWASEPAADAAIDRGDIPRDGRRPWFTSIATALLWGAFLGAAPAVATIFIPFAVLLIVPIAIGGSVLGLAAALGASLATAAAWPLVGGRRVRGFAVAAIGGTLGCAALIPVVAVLTSDDATRTPLYLGIAAAAGLVAGSMAPSFTRRLDVPTTRSAGVAVLATLAAMTAAGLAAGLAFRATLLEGAAWTEDEYACRDGETLGAFVRRVVVYLPAQSTCVYRDGSVETIPRGDHALIALVAGLGLAVMALAWVALVRRNRAHVAETQVLALTATVCTAVVLLTLLGTSLFGAFGPVASGPGL